MPAYLLAKVLSSECACSSVKAGLVESGLTSHFGRAFVSVLAISGLGLWSLVAVVVIARVGNAPPNITNYLAV